LPGPRDRSLLLVCFAGGLRRSELVAFDHEDPNFSPEGSDAAHPDGGALATLLPPIAPDDPLRARRGVLVIEQDATMAECWMRGVPER
jgi:hypothetical protein